MLRSFLQILQIFFIESLNLFLRDKKSGNRFDSIAAQRRKEAIRTPDPYVPNVVRYQLRYFPIADAKVLHFLVLANL